jgi:hypothetical protein
MKCLCIESSVVTGINVNSTNDTTLVISWKPPAYPNGDIHSYSINITNIGDGSTVRSDSKDSNIDSITETGLGELVYFSTFS